MVASLIPSQGTCLDCRFDPWSGHIQEELIDVSLSLPSSLKAMEKCLQMRIKKMDNWKTT